MVLYVKSVKGRKSKYLDQISLRRAFHHVGMGFTELLMQYDVEGWPQFPDSFTCVDGDRERSQFHCYRREMNLL
jgi:hypothetical protein